MTAIPAMRSRLTEESTAFPISMQMISARMVTPI